MHRIARNRVSGHFGVGGSPSCCQKFRQQLKSQIPATLSKIKFFFKIFSQNRHFRFLSLARKGVRLVRNFFLTWSPSIRSKTPWQTKKSNETSPRSYKYFFIPQHRFWMKFHDKSMKKANFDQTLEICNFANNPWNFLKPRLRTFWGREVPIVLPKISATT